MSISDVEFDELPEEITLEQKILEFLGKERRAYTAEEIVTGIGPCIIIHHNIPRPYNDSASTIPFPYSLELVTDTLKIWYSNLAHVLTLVAYWKRGGKTMYAIIG